MNRSAETDALVDLADDEASDVDCFMSEHMYHHSISNSYNAFACNVRCRTEALAEAFRQCVLIPRREARNRTNPPTQRGDA